MKEIMRLNFTFILFIWRWMPNLVIYSGGLCPWARFNLNLIGLSYWPQLMLQLPFFFFLCITFDCAWFRISWAQTLLGLKISCGYNNIGLSERVRDRRREHETRHPEEFKKKKKKILKIVLRIAALSLWRYFVFVTLLFR